MSSTNLFGTFLDSFAASSAARKADPAGSSAAASAAAAGLAAAPLADAALAARALGMPETKTPDPVDAILKELRNGPRAFKDLLPLAGNSAGLLLQLTERVVGAGWVAYDADRHLVLTAQGGQIAELIG